MPAVVAVLAVIEGADLPEDVLALLAHHHLDLGGTYGDPEAGDPVRYDQLRIEHDQGELGDIAARHLPGVACCRRASAPPG